MKIILYITNKFNIYVGYTVNSNEIVWFWEIVSQFNDELLVKKKKKNILQKKKLMVFVFKGKIVNVCYGY